MGVLQSKTRQRNEEQRNGDKVRIQRKELKIHTLRGRKTKEDLVSLHTGDRPLRNRTRDRVLTVSVDLVNAFSFKMISVTVRSKARLHGIASHPLSFWPRPANSPIQNPKL